MSTEMISAHAENRSAEFNRLLRAAQWSQADAARALRITPGAVSQICRGKTRPRASTVGLLQQLLRQPGRLRLSPAAAALGRLEPWECRLLSSLRKLPEAERRAIELIVRRMDRHTAKG